MDLTSILVQAAAGAIGGNAAAAAKNVSLGTMGNTITGALGGGLAGPLLGGLLGMGGGDVGAGLDFATIAQSLFTGGVSGALTAGVLGFIKSKFA